MNFNLLFMVTRSSFTEFDVSIVLLPKLNLHTSFIVLLSSIIMDWNLVGFKNPSQLKFTCWKSTIEALKKGVKYVQS